MIFDGQQNNMTHHDRTEQMPSFFLNLVEDVQPKIHIHTHTHTKKQHLDILLYKKNESIQLLLLLNL